MIASEAPGSAAHPLGEDSFHIGTDERYKL